MANTKEQVLFEKNEEPINVYVRIRPFNSEENEKRDTTALHVVNNREIHVRQSYSKKSYYYQHVFEPPSIQQEVFDTVVIPLLNEVLCGYNCTIFAYGQTGSGKTYTMTGSHGDNEGIIPRSIKKIFELLEQTGNDSSVRVSYLELYNEELFDLLSAGDSKAIRIYDDKSQKGSVIVKGLEEMTVSTEDEVQQFLCVGSEKRHVAATLMNANSSRSHTVFTITVHVREVSPTGDDLVKTGKLNLVDLAGSENIGRSGSVNLRAREAGSINQSLLTLGRVIKALTEKMPHVPYRESKLTRILQDSLGGRAKTSLIATVSAANSNLEETTSTLEYAMRVRSIQNRPERNEQLSRTALTYQFVEEIDRLKRDLHSCRTGTGICLSEEIYSRLLSDHKNIKNDLDLKTSHIENLEEQIEETTKKLNTVEKSWIDAVNICESLKKQQANLEENLSLTKKEREKQKEELDRIKFKHQMLSDDSKQLVSTVKVQYKNEGILHDKLSLLYNASHQNVKTTKDFCALFNTVSKEMVMNIDECINITRNATSQGSEAVLYLKSELNKSYSVLKQSMIEIVETWNEIGKSKNEYFDLKDSVTKRVTDYIEELYCILEGTFTKLNVAITEITNDCLNKADIIRGRNDDRRNHYQILIDTLSSVRVIISESSSKVAKLFDSVEQNTVSKCQEIDNANALLLANIRSTAVRTAQAKKNTSDVLGAIKSQLFVLRDDTRQTFIELNTYCKEADNLNNQRHEALLDLQTVASDYFNKMRNACKQISGETGSLLVKQTETVQEVAEKSKILFKPVEKDISMTIDYVKEEKDNTKVLSDDCKKSVDECASNVCGSNKVSDEYLNVISDFCHNLRETVSSSLILLNDMRKSAANISSKTENALNDGKSELATGSKYVNQNYTEMRKLLDDVRLKHPRRVGDTLQHIQPPTASTSAAKSARLDNDIENDNMRLSPCVLEAKCAVQNSNVLERTPLLEICKNSENEIANANTDDDVEI